jgi:hypothetical protein
VCGACGYLCLCPWPTYRYGSKLRVTVVRHTARPSGGAALIQEQCNSFAVRLPCWHTALRRWLKLRVNATSAAILIPLISTPEPASRPMPCVGPLHQAAGVTPTACLSARAGLKPAVCHRSRSRLHLRPHRRHRHPCPLRQPPRRRCHRHPCPLRQFRHQCRRPHQHRQRQRRPHRYRPHQCRRPPQHRRATDRQLSCLLPSASHGPSSSTRRGVRNGQCAATRASTRAVATAVSKWSATAATSAICS